MNLWLAVFLGGGAGSVVRYALSLLFLRAGLKDGFPWATLSANLIATAALAWLILRYQVHAPGKPPKGSSWRVPAHLHDAIRQDAILLKAGERNPAAGALLAFLKSETALKVLDDFGYGRPGR